MTLSGSFSFNGSVWRILAHPDQELIFLEIRNEVTKKVSFAAIDLLKNQLVLEDLSFEEPWWISLAEVSGKIVVFTIYTDTNNPDHKSTLAYDFREKKIAWWKNNYAVSGVDDTRVFGNETAGMKFLVLNLTDGQPAADQSFFQNGRNFLVGKPLQYYSETPHFETVKSFLNVKFQISAISLIEYLEFGAFICISCYVQEKDLANYLFVVNSDGDLLLKVRMADQLKGIGVDTFFILSGYLIFVKNKRELVSYKMV